MYNNKNLKSVRRKLRKDQTLHEKLVWSILRNKQIQNLKFYRQYSIDNYIIDFYCPSLRLAFEIDGGHHNELHNLQYDTNRSAFLNSLNITVLRFWNTEVTQNLSGVNDKIISVINNSSTASSYKKEEESI